MIWRPLFLAALLSSITSTAHAAESKSECFPACRHGYVCSPQGTCVSECNPPCAGGEACSSGQCVAASSAASSAAPEPSAPPSSVGLEALGGAMLTMVYSHTAPGLTGTFRVRIGHDHAFIVGPRFGVGFFSDASGALASTFGMAGLDVGYRGLFGSGRVRGGIEVLPQAQLWLGGKTLLGLGGAVGGLIRIGQIEIEVPISVVRVAPTDEPFGSSGYNAAAVTISALAGVEF